MVLRALWKGYLPPPDKAPCGRGVTAWQSSMRDRGAVSLLPLNSSWGGHWSLVSFPHKPYIFHVVPAHFLWPVCNPPHCPGPAGLWMNHLFYAINLSVPAPSRTSLSFPHGSSGMSFHIESSGSSHCVLLFFKLF